MKETIMDKIRMHIRENLIPYILLFCFFVSGAVFGAYITRTYTNESISGLKGFFEEAFNIFKSSAPDYNGIFKSTFTGSLKEIFFIWISGFTVIGMPIIFFMTAKAGFMLGFTAAFIISFYSLKGILLAVILIFLKCFIYIPLIFIISVYGISLSKQLFKMMTGKIKYRTNFKYSILSYILTLCLSVPVIVLYSLSEAYLTSNLLKLITLYI